MLRACRPAALPPPGRQARTLARVQQAAALARVQQAAAQARPDGRPTRLARWRGWNTRMLALAAAVVIAAAVGAGLLVSRPAGLSSPSRCTPRRGRPPPARRSRTTPATAGPSGSPSPTSATSEPAGLSR